MSSRTILHIDMDAFYASVEQLDDPAIRGKPVIVGGSVRGVVSAASYEARKFGIHSAMPIFKARKLCPQGVFLPVRMSRYKEMSGKVMEILGSYTPLLEQVSIDEAFLDITGTKRLKGDPLGVAMEIKERIRREVGLTCSIGMAPNKFLAKIASDMDKPDGLTVVQLNEVSAFLARLPISKISGVGKKTVEKLKKLGVETVGDVQSIPEDVAIKQLGKYGHRLLELSHGIDESAVVPDHEVKSVSTERTFAHDTSDREVLRKWLLTQAEEVGQRLRRNGLKGRTVNLKVKFQDFTTHTRSRTLDHVTDVTPEIYKAVVELLDSLTIARPVRLIGVGVSSLDQSSVQLRLFDDHDPDSRRAKVDRAVDTVKDLYGKRSIRRGSLLDFDG